MKFDYFALEFTTFYLKFDYFPLKSAWFFYIELSAENLVTVSDNIMTHQYNICSNFLNYYS